MKRIIFYLSLCPYLIVLIMTVYYGIAGYQNWQYTSYGFSAAVDFLGNLWFSEIMFTGRKWMILFLIVGYQIYYLVDCRGGKNSAEKEKSRDSKDNDGVQPHPDEAENMTPLMPLQPLINEENEEDNNGEEIIKVPGQWNAKKILFVISIGVWCLYFGYALLCIPFGYDGGIFYSSMYYGLEAFQLALFFTGISFSIIPVLPITLIYIIIYIVHIKKQKNKNKQ